MKAFGQKKFVNHCSYTIIFIYVDSFSAGIFGTIFPVFILSALEAKPYEEW